MNESSELTETVKADALAALDGMREIVRAEMLARALYVEDEVSNPARVGAVKHCAIGALWAGAGIKPELDKFGLIFLPGATENDRAPFLRAHPALRSALAALNRAAADFSDLNGLRPDSRIWEDEIEELFEGHYGHALTRRDLLGIIAAAKRSIKAT